MRTSKLLGVVFTITMIVALALTGCSSTPAPTTAPAAAPTTVASTAASAPAPATTTAAAPAAASTSAAPSGGATKTIKIALNVGLTWPIGVDQTHCIPLDVDKINSEGGLQIGPDKYKIELVIDDNKQDEGTAKTAAQKEIFQDKVNFILGDITCDSYLPLAEENKIISLVWPASGSAYNLKYKYQFHAAVTNTSFMSIIPWMAQKFPDKKTAVAALVDREDGRNYAKTMSQTFPSVGIKFLDPVYYPPTTQDFSAVGTKIAALNPDMAVFLSSGPHGDSLAAASCFQAGYKGIRFFVATTPGATTMGIAGADAVEGMYSLSWPTESDPGLTPMADTFRKAYIAKFGKWDDPEIIGVNEWWELKAALQKAGSIDPDKVAEALASGLQYECPGGQGQNLARTDLNNSRTIDTVLALPVKQIQGGKINIIDKPTLPQSIDWIKKIYGIK